MALTERERIAAEIRAELARQGRTHQEISDLLGIAQPAISVRMTGRRSWRAEEIAAIARYLDVPVQQFFPATEARAAA